MARSHPPEPVGQIRHRYLSPLSDRFFSFANVCILFLETWVCTKISSKNVPKFLSTQKKNKKIPQAMWKDVEGWCFGGGVRKTSRAVFLLYDYESAKNFPWITKLTPPLRVSGHWTTPTPGPTKLRWVCWHQGNWIMSRRCIISIFFKIGKTLGDMIFMFFYITHIQSKIII